MKSLDPGFRRDEAERESSDLAFRAALKRNSPHYAGCLHWASPDQPCSFANCFAITSCDSHSTGPVGWAASLNINGPVASITSALR